MQVLFPFFHVPVFGTINPESESAKKGSGSPAYVYFNSDPS